MKSHKLKVDLKKKAIHKEKNVLHHSLIKAQKLIETRQHYGIDSSRPWGDGEEAEKVP